MEFRKLTRKEHSIINRLKTFLTKWPNSLQIFCDDGIIIVVDRKTGQIFEDYFPMISCDGGDAMKYEYKDKHGNSIWFIHPQEGEIE